LGWVYDNKRSNYTGIGRLKKCCKEEAGISKKYGKTNAGKNFTMRPPDIHAACHPLLWTGGEIHLG
jgi:hypothetical protein